MEHNPIDLSQNNTLGLPAHARLLSTTSVSERIDEILRVFYPAIERIRSESVLYQNEIEAPDGCEQVFSINDRPSVLNPDEGSWDSYMSHGRCDRCGEDLQIPFVEYVDICAQCYNEMYTELPHYGRIDVLDTKELDDVKDFDSHFCRFT